MIDVDELILFDGVTQAAYVSWLHLHVGIICRVENRAAATKLLGVFERDVGAQKQQVGVFALRRAERDADAGRQIYQDAIDDKGSIQRTEKFAADGFGFASLTIGMIAPNSSPPSHALTRGLAGAR
jgi:hypothetical protein